MSSTEHHNEEYEMNAPTKIKSPMMELAAQADRQHIQWKQALPPHISVEKFQRVVMTAIQLNPNLINVDRKSLWLAATQAAQDGLLPDGREGVILPYSGKARWLPMYTGLIKKARNSGELATIVARVVYAADEYDYWLDEQGEHIRWRPAIAPDVTQVRCVFAMALTKDGSLYVEPMSKAEIERVRASSPSGQDPKAPWSQWWDEMAKKTALKRLFKRLPTSPELEQVFRRDDDLYDITPSRPARDVDEPPAKPVRSLEDFAKSGNGRRRKAEPAAKPRRGRPPKDKAPEPEPEPATADWLDKYRAKIDEAASPEELTSIWEEYADDYETASEEIKAEASDIYNRGQDRLEEQADLL